LINASAQSETDSRRFNAGDEQTDRKCTSLRPAGPFIGSIFRSIAADKAANGFYHWKIDKHAS